MVDCMNRALKLTLALVASAAVTLPASGSAPASAWEIGPVIDGRNYSVGLPRRPAATRTGWQFDFPYPTRDDGHVHAVSFDPGPLDRATRIVVRYRVDAHRSARFVPQEQPGTPATVSLILQRARDDWSGRGRYGSYRWYAPAAGIKTIAPGEHEIAVRLDRLDWTNVNGQPAVTDPRGFRAALADTSRIGLVFGSTSMRGHGVYATASARFTLLSFRIE